MLVTVSQQSLSLGEIELENKMVVLVSMQVVPGREVSSKWAEWSGRRAQAPAHSIGLLRCSGSEWKQAAVGRRTRLRVGGWAPALPACLAPLGT